MRVGSLADVNCTCELTTSIVAVASAVKLPFSTSWSSRGGTRVMVKFLENPGGLPGYDGGTITHEPSAMKALVFDGQIEVIVLPTPSPQSLTKILTPPPKSSANAWFPPGCRAFSNSVREASVPSGVRSSI